MTEEISGIYNFPKDHKTNKRSSHTTKKKWKKQ